MSQEKVGTVTPLRTLKALIIEDQEDDAVLLITMLKRAGYQPYYLRVDTLPALEQALKHEWDIVFSDHSMPTMDGMDALSKVREHNRDIPFIFVSGTIAEDAAVQAMRNGAQDYIMKGNLKRLIPAVQRELHDSQVRSERRRAEQRLRYLTHFDGLTGLPNRFYFLEQLERTLTRLASESQIAAILHIDLDRFKTMNDSLGYDAGNLLLQAVSRRLEQHVSNRGIVARLATDEYAIFATGFSNRTEIRKFAFSVLACLERPYEILECSFYFTSSIGVAIYPDHGKTAVDLLGNADIATNRAKDEGGKSCRFFEPTMAVRLEERLVLERNMRSGLADGEFYLLYQPQVDLSNGKIIGVEALLRWNNRERGIVSPGSFIPLAEETGFIIPLGEWVLHEACQQINRWRASEFGSVTIAVNVSARQFHDNNLPKLLKEILSEHKVDPRNLKIEITESVIIRDAIKACRVFSEIKELGVELALDDFGTGYSSLAYLKAFKVDYLKIDQSFVRGLEDDENGRTIVSAIIAMANRLSIKTIAEGVETSEQYRLLCQMGCDIGQGFLIGKPMIANSIQELSHEQYRSTR